YERFDCSALRSLGCCTGTNRVRSHCRRHDESFCVVNYKWVKHALGTFHDCFPPLNKIQDIYRAVSIERRFACEPIPACLNKFQLVQSRPFLGPTYAFVHTLDSVDQVRSYPIRLPVPGDVRDSMIKMDRPRRAI